MNLRELADALILIGIRSDFLALGGSAEMAWCVKQADDGAWEIYWLERGNKHELSRLQTESQACFYLLGRLTYSQLLAGVIRKT